MEVKELGDRGGKATVYIRHTLDKVQFHRRFALPSCSAQDLCDGCNRSRLADCCLHLQECGSHLLNLSCALWVYNMSGVPIALQPDAEDAAMQVSLLRAVSNACCLLSSLTGCSVVQTQRISQTTI